MTLEGQTEEKSRTLAKSPEHDKSDDNTKVDLTESVNFAKSMHVEGHSALNSDATASSSLSVIKPEEIKLLIRTAPMMHVLSSSEPAPIEAKDKTGRHKNANLALPGTHQSTIDFSSITAPASQKENDFLDLVYKSLRNIPDHGTDFEKKSPILSMLGKTSLYSTDVAEKFSPGKRDGISATEAVKGLKTFDELRNFVQELKKQKSESTGQALTREDLSLLNQLSNNERKSYAYELEQLRNLEFKQNQDGSTSKSTAPNSDFTMSNLEQHKQMLDQTIASRHGHLVVGMLEAMMADKPAREDLEKIAAYALASSWDNHNNGAHFKKSELLDRVYVEAEKNLSPEDLKAFSQKTSNFARAVAIHAALENRVMHGLLWHSADPISMRAVLAPLDPENRMQVVDALQELTSGHLHSDVAKRISDPQEYFAIEELLTRPGKIDAVGQVMAGLKFIERRLGLDDKDTVTGIEWAGIQNGEMGVLKRAAALSAADWKELEKQYASERNGTLEDLPKIKGMPPAFATFFQTLHQAKGDFRGYNVIKKVIDASSTSRRSDLVSLALQFATEDTRKQLMNDAEQNANKKSTMDNTLSIFGERKFSDRIDINRMSMSPAQLKQTLEEFFKDGEVSLLTKVKMYTGGRLQMQKLDYAREHEVQALSTDTDGIKSFFIGASDKQRAKVIDDLEYRQSLRSALQTAMSKREAGLLMANLIGQEGITSGLLSLRTPGWFEKTNSKDLQYKRYFEESLTEKDLQYWKAHISDSRELSRLQEDLSQVYTKAEINYIVSVMTAKFSDTSLSLEKIQKDGIGNRSLEEELKDAQNSSDLARAVLKINQKTLEELKNSEDYFAKIQLTVSETASRVTASNGIKNSGKPFDSFKEQTAALREFALEHITQLRDTKEISARKELDPIALVKLTAAVKMDDPFIALNAIQSAFDQLPDLKNRLQSDAALKGHFEQALRMAIYSGNVGSELFDRIPTKTTSEGILTRLYNSSARSINDISALSGALEAALSRVVPVMEKREFQYIEAFKRYEHILKGEPLRIEELVDFASGLAAKRDVILNYASVDEVKRLLKKTDDPKELAWQSTVLGPKQQAEVTLNCLTKGYCDAADLARITVLSNRKFSENSVVDLYYGLSRTLGTAYFGDLPAEPALSALKSLQKHEIQDVVNDGMRRYQSLGTVDLIGKATIREKLDAQLAATQTKVDETVKTLSALARRDSVRSPRWQRATDFVTGGRAGIEVENANNALIKSMLEIKDAPAAQKNEKIADFDKAMEVYARAEEGIADRTKTLADILNTASMLALWGIPAPLAFGRLIGGADLHQSLIFGKLTAKLQMPASYMLTSAALRENMDEASTVKALVLFPAVQAKFPIISNYGIGKVLGIPTTKLPMPERLEHVLHSAVNGIIISASPAMVLNNPTPSGAWLKTSDYPKNEGDSLVHMGFKPEEIPSQKHAERKERVAEDILAKLQELK